MDINIVLRQLPKLKSFDDRVMYCSKMLGNPIGKGTTRIVYPFDEAQCVKLALNQNGVEQNKLEMSLDFENYDLLVSVDRAGSDTNGLFLLSERVKTANEKDFEKLLGITWKGFCRFINQTYRIVYGKILNPCLEDFPDDIYDEMVRGGTFKQVYDYFKTHRLDYKPFPYELLANKKWVEFNKDERDLISRSIHYDLFFLRNWGVANRNGELMIVLLDSGVDKELWEKCYENK